MGPGRQPLFIPTCRTSVPCSRTSRVSLKKLKSLNFRCDSQFLKLADDIPLTLGSRNEKGLGIDPRATEGAAGSWAGPRWSTVPWRPGQAGEGGPGTPPARGGQSPDAPGRHCTCPGWKALGLTPVSVDHLGIRVRTRKMPGEPGVKTPARRRGLPPNQRLASSLVAARLGDSLFLSVAPLALSETHRLTLNTEPRRWPPVLSSRVRSAPPCPDLLQMGV